MGQCRQVAFELPHWERRSAGNARDRLHVLGELGVLLRSDRLAVFGLPNQEGQEGRGSCRSVWIADTIDGLFVYWKIRERREVLHGNSRFLFSALVSAKAVMDTKV
jgi:hypothetical protein